MSTAKRTSDRNASALMLSALIKSPLQTVDERSWFEPVGLFGEVSLPASSRISTGLNTILSAFEGEYEWHFDTTCA